MGDKSRSTWWIRLETRDRALQLARRIAADATRPRALRWAAADVLVAWDSPPTLRQLRELARDPAFRRHRGLHDHLEGYGEE